MRDPGRARLRHRHGLRPVPARRRRPADVHEQAMARTTRWAARCLAAPRPPGQALFGIVQGGIDADRRRRHLAERHRRSTSMATRSAASRWASPSQDMYAVLDEVAPQLPAERPRYLMGVGTPDDLVRGVRAGIDMFDCVMPTRNARNGQLFTSEGHGHHQPRPPQDRCGSARPGVPVPDLQDRPPQLSPAPVHGQGDPLQSARNPPQSHLLCASRPRDPRPDPRRGRASLTTRALT